MFFLTLGTKCTKIYIFKNYFFLLFFYSFFQSDFPSIPSEIVVCVVYIWLSIVILPEILCRTVVLHIENYWTNGKNFDISETLVVLYLGVISVEKSEIYRPKPLVWSNNRHTTKFPATLLCVCNIHTAYGVIQPKTNYIQSVVHDIFSSKNQTLSPLDR